jgi:hypothetical protein
LRESVAQAQQWLHFCADVGNGVAEGSTRAIARAVKDSPDVVQAVKGACNDFVVGNEMWFYLVDELTGEPVRPSSDNDLYPIRITEPSKMVTKLLPAMQVGLHAASLVNGVSGVVRLFGYPFPAVPENIRLGAQNSVELLKQDSSVEAFGAIQEKVEEGDEEVATARGESLQELLGFLEEHDKKTNAGLRLIGDGEDGTGVWTALTDPVAVKKALEKRAAQRRTERRFHEEYFGGMLRAKMAARATMKAAAGGGTAATRQLKAARRDGGGKLCSLRHKHIL